MKNIILPSPLQIVMDDLGWFCGTDGRAELNPARTGVTRRHCAEDYAVVNEIGRNLGMKINCAIVMGEWDPDNRLKHIPALSPYGENWNNASFYDKTEVQKCAEIINSSEYIDFAIHGLRHSYYIPGSCYNNTDYYYKKDNEWQCVNESEIRARLDACYDLIQYHGIKKEINSFVPPNFVYKQSHLSKILKDYNIRYVSTTFENISTQTPWQQVEMEDGIIVLDRNNNLISWDEMASKPDDIPVVNGIFGCHWANVCHQNPSKNYTLVESWVNYFEKCRQTFGTIISKDMRFCATQSIYKKYAQTKEENGVFTIDLSNIPQTDSIDNHFWVSSKHPFFAWTGCDVEIYEKCECFVTYQITPKEKIITLTHLS